MLQKTRGSDRKKKGKYRADRNKAQLDEIMYKLYEAGDHKGVET